MQEMQETRSGSLNGEVPQEKRMATHSSILAWRLPRTEDPSELWSTCSQRVGHASSNLACTHVLELGTIEKDNLSVLEYTIAELNS